MVLRWRCAPALAGPCGACFGAQPEQTSAEPEASTYMPVKFSARSMPHQPPGGAHRRGRMDRPPVKIGRGAAKPLTRIRASVHVLKPCTLAVHRADAGAQRMNVVPLKCRCVVQAGARRTRPLARVASNAPVERRAIE
eukprot:scaffold2911_cov414-Prasinococcus_capsulatus_cf.AAC.42